MAKRPKVYPIKVASAVVDLPGKEKPVRCEFQAMRVGPFLFLTHPWRAVRRVWVPDREGDRRPRHPDRRRLRQRRPLLRLHGPGPQGRGLRAEHDAPGRRGRADHRQAVLRLADRVIGDVFESFAPTLPVENKYYTPSIPIDKSEKTKDRPRAALSPLVSSDGSGSAYCCGLPL